MSSPESLCHVYSLSPVSASSCSALWPVLSVTAHFDRSPSGGSLVQSHCSFNLLFFAWIRLSTFSCLWLVQDLCVIFCGICFSSWLALDFLDTSQLIIVIVGLSYCRNSFQPSGFFLEFHAWKFFLWTWSECSAQRGQQEKREFLGEGPVSQQHTCSCTERSHVKWAEEVIIE